ncbi:hypothetical protein THIOM_004159 [Candidatus Thiomargarita nelsonii]|uniref:Uncharacterized protein n=1 Tax=Candidatus Thiomargarita nelsonii TaxID=1003181 RepID=A0A176RWQ6_9GAMM|nr:hypothetical protein THIOM_004159 [Candidatus Thiomargarita nelsonii]
MAAKAVVGKKILRYYTVPVRVRSRVPFFYFSKYFSRSPRFILDVQILGSSKLKYYITAPPPYDLYLVPITTTA